MSEGSQAKPIAWKTLKQFTIQSKPGNERRAMDLVADALRGENLSPQLLDRIRTAVAEATLNAMEHGSGFRDEFPVDVVVAISEDQVRVRVTDVGMGEIVTREGPPDLNAKLDEQESPRGWGLFLIQNMVDTMNILTEDQSRTVELLINKTDNPNWEDM